jgi:tetratricopeptide (TPR) repeat protein
LPSPSPDPSSRALAGQLVVFSGKLSLFGRKDAHNLVARLGGATSDDVNAKTTMLVIGESRDKSSKLRKAEELNTGLSARIEILNEDQFCRRAGLRSPDQLRRQYHALRDLLARYRSLSEVHIRYLVKCGLIRPVLRTNLDTLFAFGDLAIIKQVSEALDQQIPFRAIVRSLLASRQGQLTLDFRLDASPAKIIALPPRSTPPAPLRPTPQPTTERDTALAEEYFRMASALDADGDEANLEDAATAYRRALELDPYLVAALINLANIHYSRDELVEAQALYERAIGLESDFFEAHFNLGNIYHDLGRFTEAQACYLEALKLNPFYADTHFYLAVTFEKMGLSHEARPHWRSYQQLAPKGEWVELAREFSE